MFKEVIYWNETGKSFLIRDQQSIEALLPEIYKTSSYKSFVRQLNVYGFKKKRNKNKKIEFRNKNFIKGKKDLLFNIKRKKPQNKLKLINHIIDNDELFYLTEKIPKMEKKIELLQFDNMIIEGANKQIKSKIAEFNQELDKRIFDFCEVFLLMLVYFNETMLDKLTYFSIDQEDFIFDVDFTNKEEVDKLICNYEFFEKCMNKDVNDFLLCPMGKWNMLNKFSKYLFEFTSNYEKPKNYELIKNKLQDLVCNHIITQKSYMFDFDAYYFFTYDFIAKKYNLTQNTTEIESKDLSFRMEEFIEFSKRISNFSDASMVQSPSLSSLKNFFK